MKVKPMRPASMLSLAITIIVISSMLVIVSNEQILYSTSSGLNSHSKQVEWLLSESPIVITQDSDFSLLGFPGSGTPGEPYRIENLTIDGLGGSCITINDTSVNFVIKNCSLYNGYFSLTINRAANGIISYCNFTSNFLAIYMDSCSSINVHHNNFSGNTRGVWCEAVSGVFIDYNNVTNVPGAYGVAFNNCWPADYNRVRYNNISGCADGILIQFSDLCVILGNTITDNTIGIWSHSGAWCTIRGNYLGHNSQYNAVDDGHDNYWDNGAGLKGNFWDDYVSGATYSIPGTAGDEDQYPRAWPLDAPEIDSPEDIVYTRGENGNSITWNVGDLHPSNYAVLRNGSTIESDVWDGSNIAVDVDGLLPGIYNYSVYVEDLGGNSAHDTVIVTVLRDITDPKINQPSDINIVEGSAGVGITWLLADVNPSNYTVYQNNSLLLTSIWVSNRTVDVNLDELEPGVYNFTILLEDLDGNTASDIVLVQIVYDSFSPVFQSCTRPEASFYFGEDDEGPIVWLFSDVNPQNYIMYRDGVIQDSGTWSGEEITYTISEFPVGSYNITLVVYDENGNYARHVVQVTVTERPPFIVINLAIIGVGGFTILGIIWKGMEYIRNRKKRN